MFGGREKDCRGAKKVLGESERFSRLKNAAVERGSFKRRSFAILLRILYENRLETTEVSEIYETSVNFFYVGKKNENFSKRDVSNITKMIHEFFLKLHSSKTVRFIRKPLTAFLVDNFSICIFRSTYFFEIRTVFRIFSK